MIITFGIIGTWIAIFVLIVKLWMLKEKLLILNERLNIQKERGDWFKNELFKHIREEKTK